MMAFLHAKCGFPPETEMFFFTTPFSWDQAMISWWCIALAMVTHIYGAVPNLTLGDRLPRVSCQIYIQVECYCYLLLYFQVSRGDKTLFTSALIILCWLYSYMLVNVCMSCLVCTLIQSTIVLVRGFMIGRRSTTDKIWNAVSACLLHISYFTKLDGYLLVMRAVVTDYNIVIESKNIRLWLL